jgi:hypothetical protein
MRHAGAVAAQAPRLGAGKAGGADGCEGGIERRSIPTDQGEGARRSPCPGLGTPPGLSLTVPHAVEIDGLWTRYGATTALEDITLFVRSHEALGVIGRHGAGKTSLLKAVLGLLITDAGSIRVFGEPHHTPDPRLRIGYLPQRFRPPGDLLGHEYVRLTLAFYGRHAKRPQTAVLAEQIDLDPAALDRPIRS